VELLRLIKGSKGSSTPGQENLSDNTLTENWNLADGNKENYIPKVVGGTCDETSVITTSSKAKQNFVDTQSVYTNCSSSKNKCRSAITDDENTPTTSSSKPITANTSVKKPRGVAHDTLVEAYRFKKELLANEAAQEVRRHNRDACDENRRHNRAMEDIAYTTVRMEKEKVNLEMLAIAKASQLDNKKKELELKIQKYNTYLSLKKKGMSDQRIIELFPAFDEFIAHEEKEVNAKEVNANPNNQAENNALDEDN
jgi:hypothetical protein